MERAGASAGDTARFRRSAWRRRRWCCAALGAALEIALLRRIYRAPELLQLLATFGVVLIVQDATQAIWGAEDLSLPRPAWMRAFVAIGTERFPAYDLLLIAAGPAVLGALWLLLHRTRFGTLVRAATQDREMVAALGVDQRVLFTAVFALGAGLAGLGGALALPDGSASLQLDLSVITDAFVIVVVGGLGSLPGAYLASLLIGVMQSLGILFVPKLTLVMVFAVMAAVLVVRPQGLLGRAGATVREAAAPPLVRPAPPALRWLGASAFAAAAGGAVDGRAVRAFGADRGDDRGAVRSLAAFHDGARRDAELRPCRVVRARRLWRGTGGNRARLAAAGGTAAGAVRRRPRRRGVRLVRGAAVGRVSGDADAGFRADRVGGRGAMERHHRRR